MHRALPLVAAVVVLAALAGCVEPPKGFTPLGECARLQMVNVTAAVEGAAGGVERVVLVPPHKGYAYRAMLSCVAPQDQARPAVLIANGTLLSGEAGRAPYDEVRVFFANGSLLRLQVEDLVPQEGGQVTVDAAAGEVQWNGTALPVPRLEWHDTPHALDPFRVEEGAPLGNRTTVRAFNASTTWNGGLQVVVNIGYTEPQEALRNDPSRWEGTRLRAEVVAPNGTVVANLSLDTPFDGHRSAQVPVDRVGAWQVRVTSERGLSQPGTFTEHVYLDFTP